MKWFFVTSNPWPMHHGTALRVYHLARELAKNNDVEIITDWFGDDADIAYGLIDVSVNKISLLLKDPNNKSPYPCNSELYKHLINRSGEADVVVLFGVKMLQYSPACKKAKIIIADMIDEPILAAKRRIRSAKQIKWIFRNLSLIRYINRYEKSFINHVDLFTFVTSVDSASFKKRNQKTNVETIANGVSVSYWKSINLDNTDVSPYVIFVGNYHFVPNRTAAEFLIHKIAPIVWRSCPGIHFKFVGGNPPDWLLNNPDERVEAVGFVDDVRPYVMGAKIVAIPMVTGTGIKNKLLEAWAARKPVVATPIAIQGIPGQHGVNILIGEKKGEIASMICKLWQDDNLCNQIANNGRAVIERQFSWEVFSEKYIFHVNRLLLSKFS